VAQPVITDRSVLALDVGILLGLARLDVVDFYALFLSPCNELVADVFRAVVAANSLRLPLPLDELREIADDSLSGQ
jgi:hypothetical protein